MFALFFRKFLGLAFTSQRIGLYLEFCLMYTAKVPSAAYRLSPYPVPIYLLNWHLRKVYQSEKPS